MTTLLSFLAEGQGIGIKKSAIELGIIDSAIPINLKSTNLINDTVVTTAASGTTLDFTDIENTDIGIIQPHFFNNGTQMMRIFTQRKLENESLAYNGVALELDSEGKPIIEFMGTNTKKA